MRSPAVIAAIVGKELRQTWRDRSVIGLVFVVPLLLAAVTSLAFSDVGSSGAARIGVVDLDHGASAVVLTDEVLPQLRSAGGSALVTVVRYDDAAAARGAVDRGDLAAAVVLPAGFSAAVATGTPSTIELIAGPADSLGTPVARSVLAGFTAQVGTNQLAVALATTGGGAAARTPELVTAANALRSPVDLSTVLAGRGTLSARSFFAPSMVVLALFFCGQALARGLVNERRTRTLDRMLVAGVPLGRILVGKYLTSVLVGLLAAGVVLGTFAAIGTPFGSTWVLVVLVLASAVAMISTAALAVLLARDDEQAGTVGIVVAFVLAILGGNFVPLAQSGGALSVLALFTPNGWAIRGFADLSVATGSAWDTVSTTVLVLLGFTVLTGVPALLLSRRAVGAARA